MLRVHSVTWRDEVLSGVLCALQAFRSECCVASVACDALRGECCVRLRASVA